MRGGKHAGSREMSLDTADSIQIPEGLEGMLAHPLATAHVAAMMVALLQMNEASRSHGTARQAACVEAEPIS
jgi:hypothetical protein